MRYLDPVSFVDVGQLIAGYSLEMGVNLGGRGTLIFRMIGGVGSFLLP
jgi:hypothetical protein